MPVFDGLELAQMIRQPGANANPFAPIIMVTGHTEKARVTAARDAGITEFLAKPISAKALYQRVVNVVANPRPFIKTKTYFGPDRRRNVNPNYVGPERRKGGKADVIRQQSLLDKAKAIVDLILEYRGMNDPEAQKPDIVTYGDHEIITPDTSKLRKLVRPAAPGDKIRWHAPSRRWRRSPASSPSWMNEECERLDAARRKVKETGLNKVATTGTVPCPPTT